MDPIRTREKARLVLMEAAQRIRGVQAVAEDHMGEEHTADDENDRWIELYGVLDEINDDIEITAMRLD